MQAAKDTNTSDSKSGVNHGQNSSLRMPSFIDSAVLHVRGGSGLTKVYSVCIYIAIALSVLVGVWICPKLNYVW